MKPQEAKALTLGQYVYHVWKRQRNGMPIRGKVCSIKLWKREPDRFCIGLRLGFTDHIYLKNLNVHEWHLTLEDLLVGKRFCVEDAHLEIIPEFGFTELRETNKETKEQTVFHNYAIRLYLIINGANNRACVAFDTIMVPAKEFPNSYSFIGHIPTIRRAITRMKRRAHKIFNTKEAWYDLHDNEQNVIGIRTI